MHLKFFGIMIIYKALATLTTWYFPWRKHNVDNYVTFDYLYEINLFINEFISEEKLVFVALRKLKPNKYNK